MNTPHSSLIRSLFSLAVISLAVTGSLPPPDGKPLICEESGCIYWQNRWCLELDGTPVQHRWDPSLRSVIAIDS